MKEKIEALQRIHNQILDNTRLSLTPLYVSKETFKNLKFEVHVNATGLVKCDCGYVNCEDLNCKTN